MVNSYSISADPVVGYCLRSNIYSCSYTEYCEFIVYVYDHVYKED